MHNRTLKPIKFVLDWRNEKQNFIFFIMFTQVLWESLRLIDDLSLYSIFLVYCYWIFWLRFVSNQKAAPIKIWLFDRYFSKWKSYINPAHLCLIPHNQVPCSTHSPKSNETRNMRRPPKHNSIIIVLIHRFFLLFLGDGEMLRSLVKHLRLIGPNTRRTYIIPITHIRAKKTCVVLLMPKVFFSLLAQSLVVIQKQVKLISTLVASYVALLLLSATIIFICYANNQNCANEIRNVYSSLQWFDANWAILVIFIVPSLKN